MADYTELVKFLRGLSPWAFPEASNKRMQEAADAIEALQAKLPKRGEWITKRTWNHDGELYCSVCDYDAPTEGDYRQVKTNYCPNCGAKMEVQE